MTEKLHTAPYGVRPVPNEDHQACVYQVHNIDTGNNIGTPFPTDAKQDAFKLARDLNDEWKAEHEKNISREQLVGLLDQLARSACNWNDAAEDEDRGRGNMPLIILICEDGSGIVANDTLPGMFGSGFQDVLNVQKQFKDAEEGADYLIEMHDALDRCE